MGRVLLSHCLVEWSYHDQIPPLTISGTWSCPVPGHPGLARDISRNAEADAKMARKLIVDETFMVVLNERMGRVMRWNGFQKFMLTKGCEGLTVNE